MRASDEYASLRHFVSGAKLVVTQAFRKATACYFSSGGPYRLLGQEDGK